MVPLWCPYEREDHRRQLLLVSESSSEDDNTATDVIDQPHRTIVGRTLQGSSPTVVRINVEVLFLDSSSVTQLKQVIDKNPTAWATSLVTNISSNNPSLFSSWSIAAVNVASSTNGQLTTTTADNTSGGTFESFSIITIIFFCFSITSCVISVSIVIYLKLVWKRNTKVAPITSSSVAAQDDNSGTTTSNRTEISLSRTDSSSTPNRSANRPPYDTPSPKIAWT